MTPTSSKRLQRGGNVENLRTLYPLAFRSIIRRSITWLLLYGVGLFVLVGLLAMYPANFTVSSLSVGIVALFAATVGLTATVVICAKLFYEFLYHLTYSYTLELDHLVIARGIIFRTKASFPIARISDTYITRNLGDLMFGLHTVQVLTAGPIAEFGTIEGLTSRSAAALQNRLLALIETTLPDVDSVAATDALNRSGLDQAPEAI